MSVIENLPLFHEDILQLLPHRYPFLLVDRVVEISAQHIKALKNVSANEPFFPGHFPSLAVMPGVLQVEAMAQAGGILLAKQGSLKQGKHIGFLAGLDGVRYKAQVRPGDQLLLFVEIAAMKKSVVKLKGEAHVSGKLVSEGEITIVIKELSPNT